MASGQQAMPVPGGVQLRAVPREGGTRIQRRREAERGAVRWCVLREHQRPDGHRRGGHDGEDSLAKPLSGDGRCRLHAARE